MTMSMGQAMGILINKKFKSWAAQNSAVHGHSFTHSLLKNMKNLIVFCCAALLSQAAFAQQTPTPTTGMVKKTAVVAKQQQSAQFQVWGNCGMCKKTIETAAKNVPGVETADWNVETHQFSVVFDPTKTSVEKVHQAIAAAGYDTELVRGDDAAYKNLHSCCHYERRKS